MTARRRLSKAILEKSDASYSFDPGTCPGASEAPTPLEMNFAADPHLKFFSYDINHAWSWDQLAGLRSCLSAVKLSDLKGLPADIAGKNLWDATARSFLSLTDVLAGVALYRQQWIEYNSKFLSDTVVPSLSVDTPYKLLPASFNLQQPCNAVTNAAFWEIAIDICKRPPSLVSLPDGYPMRTMMMMGPASMAWGSFAMHSNPTSGNFSQVFNTGRADVTSMGLTFYPVYEAMIRFLAYDATDAEKQELIRFQFLPGSSHLSAVDSMGVYLKLALGNPSMWPAWENDLAAAVPPFKLAIAGMILSNLRTMLHPELFGSSADPLFKVSCSKLMGATGAIDPAQVTTICNLYTAKLLAVNWKVAKDFTSMMRSMVEGMSLFLEASYWQEELTLPADYHKKLKSQGIFTETPTDCWRNPHGSWHRIAAQMIKLVVENALDLDKLVVTPPLSQEHKQKAWSQLPDVINALGEFAQILQLPSDTTKVNVCRIFKRVKDGAKVEGGMPRAPRTDYLGLDYWNGLIDDFVEKLAKNPPLPPPMTGRWTPLKCYYEYGLTIGSLDGLSNIHLKANKREFELVPSDRDHTTVRAKMSVWVCPVKLSFVVTGYVKQERKVDLGDAKFCPGIFNIPLTAKASFKTGYVYGSVAADIRLDNLFDQSKDPLGMSIISLGIECNEFRLESLRFSSEYKEEPEGEFESMVNKALSAGDGFLVQTACKKINEEVSRIAKEALGNAVGDMNKMMQQQFAPRRLRTQVTECPSLTDTTEDGSLAEQNRLAAVSLAVIIGVSSGSIAIMSMLLWIWKYRPWWYPRKVQEICAFSRRARRLKRQSIRESSKKKKGSTQVVGRDSKTSFEAAYGVGPQDQQAFAHGYLQEKVSNGTTWNHRDSNVANVQSSNPFEWEQQQQWHAPCHQQQQQQQWRASCQQQQLRQQQQWPAHVSTGANAWPSQQQWQGHPQAGWHAPGAQDQWSGQQQSTYGVNPWPQQQQQWSGHRHTTLGVNSGMQQQWSGHRHTALGIYPDAQQQQWSGQRHTTLGVHPVAMSFPPCSPDAAQGIYGRQLDRE